MKSVVFIVAALLTLAILIGVAGYKFDKAPGEIMSDSTEVESDSSTENTNDQGTSNIPAAVNKGPDFTVVDENGNDVKRSDLIGKPTVVLFWASWYADSREELAVLQDCYAIYKDEVAFMAVCIIDGERETLESAKAFLADNQFDFPIYFDVYSDVRNNYDLTSRTYFFTANTKYAARLSEGVVLRPDLMDEAILIITQ